jgi:hypothetical protein
VLDILPFPLPYEFIPFMNESSRKSAGTYDDLLRQIDQVRVMLLKIHFSILILL